MALIQEIKKFNEDYLNNLIAEAKKFWEGVKRGESFDVLCGYVQKSFIQKVVRIFRYIGIRLNLKR